MRRALAFEPVGTAPRADHRHVDRQRVEVPLDEINVVAAVAEEHPATELIAPRRPVPDTVTMVQKALGPGTDLEGWAVAALDEQLLEPRRCGTIPHRVRDHQAPVNLVGHPDHLPALRLRHRHRLLDHDVLPGPQRGDSLGGVEVVGGADGDRVYVVEARRPVGDGAAAHLVGQLPRTVSVHIGDPRERAAGGRQVSSMRVRTAHPATAYNAEPQHPCPPVAFLRHVAQPAAAQRTGCRPAPLPV